MNKDKTCYYCGKDDDGDYGGCDICDHNMCFNCNELLEDKYEENWGFMSCPCEYKSEKDCHYSQKEMIEIVNEIRKNKISNID